MRLFLAFLAMLSVVCWIGSHVTSGVACAAFVIGFSLLGVVWATVAFIWTLRWTGSGNDKAN